MDDRLLGWGRIAVWALPAYGVLLALGTFTQQPDYQADFPAYARYVTTTRFLASHLIASVAGAGFGIVGAAGVVVLAGGAGPRRLGWAFGLWSFAQVGLASVFGVAAFFQPAIGRAFLEWNREIAVAINADVYGGALFLTAGLSVLLFIAGGVLLGTGAGRTPPWSQWAGRTFAVSVAVFAVGNVVAVPFVQPLAGLGIALAGAGIAIAARRWAVGSMTVQVEGRTS